MFSHLIQLLRARRALRAERFETALSLLEDPLVREDRRAKELRGKALQQLLRRAKQRSKREHPKLALRDLDRLLELDPEYPEGRELRVELQARVRDQEARNDEIEAHESAFERAMNEGRLNEARDFLRELEGKLAKDRLAEHKQRLERRRKSASQALKRVRDALDKGMDGEAREELDQARRLCADSLTFRERLVGLSAKWAKERWEEVGRALTEGRAMDAARSLSEWWEAEPGSEDLAEAQDLLLSVGEKLASEIRDLAERGDFPRAFEISCQIPSPVKNLGVMRRLREQIEQVHSILSAPSEDPRRLAQGLLRIEAETKWPSLAGELQRLKEEQSDLDEKLRSARERISSGDLEGARDALDLVLDRWSGCEEARALLDGLLEDERDRKERLRLAREALREGRLQEAQRQLLRLLSGGFGAEEARALLRDVERIRGKVQRELVSYAARFDGGMDPELVLEGLERLKKTQADSVELEDLEARVLRRKARVAREHRIDEALEHRDAKACLAALREILAEGGEGGLQQGERQALREIGERMASALKRELASGDPIFVLDLAHGLRSFEEALEHPFSPLAREAEDRISRARALASRGLDCLASKDTDAAREAFEEAKSLAPGEALVLRLAHRLLGIERDSKGIREALALVDADRVGAQDRLDELGPTPRPLGSMVLQLKDRLSRSGDFERGCRLEVEEAGEFLLLTEDRLRIGNATSKALPQIPVLAKIRGHHASLLRAVSFHGGVKDNVQAEAGAPMTVNGRRSESTPLSHGDRIVLGGILPFLYQKPSPRSASAVLKIERGFECLGATRILWLKQGGKDGRAFFGRGRDVHVRVRAAEPELSIYAPGPGKLRIAFAGVGELDGEEFSGERDLAPGMQVSCGEIRFRILPL